MGSTVRKIHRESGTPCRAQSEESCPLGETAVELEEFISYQATQGVDEQRLRTVISDGAPPNEALDIIREGLDQAPESSRTDPELTAAEEKLSSLAAKSAELEAAAEQLIAKIKRSDPGAVPDLAYKHLAQLEEAGRLARKLERNAAYDLQLAQHRAVAEGRLRAEDLPEDNPQSHRGSPTAETGLQRVDGNMRFYGEDAKRYKEVIEGELAAWKGISNREARAELRTLWKSSSSPEEFDQLVVQSFQESAGERSKDRVFIDLETTGFDPYRNEIIEVGILRVSPSGKVLERISERFDRERPEVRDTLGVGPEFVHRISRDDLKGKPSFSDPAVQERLGRILNDPTVVMVPHHQGFENGFLSEHLRGFRSAHMPNSAESLSRRQSQEDQGQPRVQTTDTRVISTILRKSAKNNLQYFATANGVSEEEYRETAHGAFADADMTRRALERFEERLRASPAGVRPDDSSGA